MQIVIVQQRHEKRNEARGYLYANAPMGHCPHNQHCLWKHAYRKYGQVGVSPCTELVVTPWQKRRRLEAGGEEAGVCLVRVGVCSTKTHETGGVVRGLKVEIRESSAHRAEATLEWCTVGGDRLMK